MATPSCPGLFTRTEHRVLANPKPKHQKRRRFLPRVKLFQAEKCACAKALQLSRSIAHELATAEAKRRERHTPRPAPQTAAPGSTVSAYYSHYEDIQKHLAVEDLSRVDAMIAVRLRANGHSAQAVTNAIMQCAPTIRQKSEGRNWQRYAERTTDYAFSVAGDVALAKHARQMEQWRKVEERRQPSRKRRGSE